MFRFGTFFLIIGLNQHLQFFSTQFLNVLVFDVGHNSFTCSFLQSPRALGHFTPPLFPCYTTDM